MSLLGGIRTLLRSSTTPLRLTSLLSPQVTSKIHTCAVLQKKLSFDPPKEPKQWPKYNDIVYPPQKEGEARRPAEVTHFRANIKYSQKKLWYIASMIRGLSIDEALKQLDFYKRAGAAHVKEVLLEAQEMAVNDHNVEFKSNLWVEESKIGKALTMMGMRKGARGRYTNIQHRYTHYFVRLREGRPPKHYYLPEMTGKQKMEDHLQTLRNRRVYHSL